MDCYLKGSCKVLANRFSSSLVHFSFPKFVRADRKLFLSRIQLISLTRSYGNLELSDCFGTK